MAAEPITERELDLLVAYLQEGTIKAAAYECGIAHQTAKDRLHRLYRRHGWKTIAEAVWQHRKAIERHTAA